MSNDSDSSDDDCLYHFHKMHRHQRSENYAKKRQSRGGGSKVGKATTTNVNRFRAEYDKLLKRSTLMHISGGTLGCVVPYLKRFFEIWLRLIHTFNRRRKFLCRT